MKHIKRALWAIGEGLLGLVIVARNLYKQTARRLRYWMEARNGE